MLEALTSDEGLTTRLERLRRDTGGGRDLHLALVAALLGHREEADAALLRGRDGTTSAQSTVAAFVALCAGDARRALVAAERAPEDELARALAAEAFERIGRLDEAEERIASVPASHPYARMTIASLALRRADAPRALAVLEGTDPSGLLGARARRIRGEVWLGIAGGREARRARDEVSAAVWRLVRLGAPAELGRCYLQMADVETALGGAREEAAKWLARAQPLLARAGTPADEERLRRAFRRFGRRSIDRLVDADLERVIEGARSTRARALDLAGAVRDLRARGESADAIGEELGSLVSTLGERNEEVISSLEGALVDRDQTGRLVGVCRELLLLQDPRVIDHELPRLALELGAEAAVLHHAQGARTVAVASLGSWPEEAAVTPDELALALALGTPQTMERGAGRTTLVPIAARDGARVLALHRGSSRGARSTREDERLAIVGSVATAAFESAHAAAALREAAARDAATLEAIREGILTLDDAGRVRSLNASAAAVLGLARGDAEGRTLASLPGLAPLADAIARGIEDEPVRLPRVEVLVRVRPYTGGVVATVQELDRARQLAHRLVGSEARFTFDDLIGRDSVFHEVLADARRVALTDVPALVTGESGTGKELFAQAIHNASPRANHPFVGVNVAAIPRELLESELFGYEAGAFTGARGRGHPGRFELADRGTLLLDEIGDMPLEMQAKLLRVLQERVVFRLGGTRAIPVRTRVLATTHRDLEQAVKEGTFRLDLFYRLRVVHLRLPPLRSRRGDVRTLTEHYLATLAQRTGRSSLTVSPAVMTDLEHYAWPGNVRELANLLEGVASLLPRGQSVISETPAAIRRALRPPSERAPVADVPAITVPTNVAPVAIESLERIERRAIEHAIAASDGNLARAARALGVARNTLYNKIARYGLRVTPNS